MPVSVAAGPPVKSGDVEGLERLVYWAKRNSPDASALAEQLLEWSPVRVDERALAPLVLHAERVYHMFRVVRALGECLGDGIVFGGGSILNYLYIAGFGEPPRFTFDVDSSTPRELRSKRELLGPLLEVNRMLEERGDAFTLIVGGVAVPIGYVIYDAEKDHFPYMLSLKVPTVMVHGSGEPIHRYLSRVSGVQVSYRSVRELRDTARQLGARELRVDEVRLEISIRPQGSVVSERLRLPFGLGAATLQVTDPHDQVAWKIAFKLGNRWGEALAHAAHDILKALLDVRAAERLEASMIARRLSAVGPPPPSAVEENTRASMSLLRRYYSRFHYTLVRMKYRSLEEIVEKNLNIVKAIYSTIS